jgi:DNA-directed RNA polymerase specialized sigma24 family protein
MPRAGTVWAALAQVIADLLAAGSVDHRSRRGCHPQGAHPAPEPMTVQGGAAMTVSPPPGSPAGSAATEAFACHRELLFGVVYGMLGTVADTEDVLRDTWHAWARRPARDEHAARPRACLLRAALRQALARHDAIARRRAAYIGPWLPEPLVGPGALPLATLVALDDLSALERAVFVLGEVAGCAPEQIAEIVGRSPAAVRQLATRATARVEARRPGNPADPAIRPGITARFAAAMPGGDPAAFGRLLAPEVTFRTDTGGKARGPCLTGVHPRERAAALLAAGSYWPRADPQVRCLLVNGEESLVVTAADVPFAVLVLDLDPAERGVRGIYAVTNPDKLRGSS